MPKRVVDLREQRALLDIASYGRRGPGHRPLTRAEVEHVSRTARRVPEVMIKVSGGARSLRGVQAHLDYIGREGEGVIETDDGAQLQEKGFEKALVKDWDLDLDEYRRHTQRAVAVGRKPPKLVHNLVFSMPKGTPPAIVKTLHDAAVEAMNSPVVKERLEGIGAMVVAPNRQSSEYLGKFTADEIKKWEAPIKASGVSVE